MNGVFRHMAVRLWGTMLIGSLICLVLLPAWQGALGLAAIHLPVVMVLALSFMLLGWVMNRIGLVLIRRQVSEAAVWERAGMSIEAENAFERAKAIYDGFWLSPIARRRCADLVSKRLARFYLAQATLGRKDHAMVLSYLTAHPEDDAVALAWLEAALSREHHSPLEQEIAARVGDALEANDQVQRLLMQFYLADDRVDFEALQTYRRVWLQRGDLPESLIRTLARVLLNESIINDWALDVFLRGYALGDPHCLEGIAAGERMLSPNTDNRHDLAAAKEILSVLDENQRLRLVRPFEPKAPAPEKTTKAKTVAAIIARPGVEESTPVENEKFELGNWNEEEADAILSPTAKPRIERISALAASAGRLAAAVVVLIRRYLWLLVKLLHGIASRAFTASSFRVKNGIVKWRQSATVRRRTSYAVAGVIVLTLAIVGLRSLGGSSDGQTQPTPSPVAQATPAPVNDPFTIQVAAYLKPEDAQRLVGRLKEQQIDAFLKKASSENRTWFQVKVSHFPTRDEARKYGEQLKSKGLIDDFYVANYTK